MARNKGKNDKVREIEQLDDDLDLGTDPSGNPVEPISDEELDALIEDAATDSELDYVIQLVRCTEPLREALLQRNSKNRFLNQSWVNALAQMMLTPLVDDRGNVIKGTSEWDYTYPKDVVISDEGYVHDSQHTLTAQALALQLWDQNQQDIKEGKAVDVDYLQDYGITRERLEGLHLLIKRGYPESAADLIDTSRTRTPRDVLYRHEWFTDCDYSSLGKYDDNGVLIPPSPARIAKWQNQEAGLLASTLRFLYYRFAHNGSAPRGCTAKFTIRMAQKLVEEMPTTVDSVHACFLLVYGESANFSKKSSSLLKGVNISFPYLCTCHFLASMTNAVLKKTKDGQVWQPTDEDWESAYNYIKLILFRYPAEDLQRCKLLSQILDAASVHPDKTVDQSGTRFFTRDNNGLNALFHALGWGWREYIGLPIAPSINIDSIISGRAGYSCYGDGKGFDKMPKHELPNPNVRVGKKTLEEKQEKVKPTMPKPRRR